MPIGVKLGPVSATAQRPSPVAPLQRTGSLLGREGLDPLLSIGSVSLMDEGFITPELIREIDACDVSFAEYNAVRALRLEDGQFEKKRFGGAWAIRDRTRDSAYYNRVVGFCERDADRLEELIEYHAEVGKDCAISLTPNAANKRLLARLGEAGFRLLESTCLFARRTAEDVHAPLLKVAASLES